MKNLHIHEIVLGMVDQKEQSSFTKKELVDVLKGIEEREYQSRVKQAWDNSH